MEASSHGGRSVVLPGQTIWSARTPADDSPGVGCSENGVLAHADAYQFEDRPNIAGITPLSWDNVVIGSSRSDMFSRPQSARSSASCGRRQSPRSPKVPRQRLHDGLRHYCNRFLGERIDHDLVQEVLHCTAANAKVIRMERGTPMFSAFYGRKLQSADKVSVYGNKVGMASTRTFNSCLRRLTL